MASEMTDFEEKTELDIVVIGGGCAGFQLLQQLSAQHFWGNMRVTLLSNDAVMKRSWCFWDTEKSPLQHLVSKSWSNISFRSSNFSITESILPYQYHYIKGEHFFDYFRQEFLPKRSNINSVLTQVQAVSKENRQFKVCSDTRSWTADHVFSNAQPIDFDKAQFKLWQHFKGWFVKTETPIFDDSTVVLMDFSIPQENDTRFIYVLPFSPNEALIEMTVFSPEESYSDEIYDASIKDYIKKHYEAMVFEISETEKGKIPMTDAPFSRYGQNGEFLIGTAAGMVKATTGYAFKRIGRDSQQLAENLLDKSNVQNLATKGRFRFYDRLLLGILSEQPQYGHKIFSRLFGKTNMKTIFRFLDEETTLWEEIKIFATLPFAPFIRQVVKQFFR